MFKKLKNLAPLYTFLQLSQLFLFTIISSLKIGEVAGLMDTNSQVWVESHDNNHLLSVTHSVTYIANILDTGANITCSASQVCVY